MPKLIAGAPGASVTAPSSQGRREDSLPRSGSGPTVSLRYDTAVAEICAAPGCAEVVARAATGRPAVFCSAACRVRAHRARRLKAAEPVEVEVDMGSATSRGRLLEQAWMVRLRRGQRSVIVAVGLRRPAADRLAGQIADLLDTDQP